jgi:Fe-S cluster assembly iron-binding protein IscA
MLTMTDTAAEAVRQIAGGSGLEPDPGLRISTGEPTEQGTPLELSIAPAALPTDHTVDKEGAHLYLDDVVVPALDEMVLDAAIEGDQVRFELREAQPDAGNNGTGPAA